MDSYVELFSELHFNSTSAASLTVARYRHDKLNKTLRGETGGDAAFNFSFHARRDVTHFGDVCSGLCNFIYR